jgi:hypothetical protein
MFERRQLNLEIIRLIEIICMLILADIAFRLLKVCYTNRSITLSMYGSLDSI